MVEPKKKIIMLLTLSSVEFADYEMKTIKMTHISIASVPSEFGTEIRIKSTNEQ